MRSVPAQAGLGVPGLGRRTPPAIPLALTALALAATCGVLASMPSGHGGSAPSRPAGGAVIGTVPLQRARCSDWATASGAERSATFAALRSSVGGATGFGPATTLSPREAGALFDGTCAHAYASSFLLYELYIRAAGFRTRLPASTDRAGQ